MVEMGRSGFRLEDLRPMAVPGYGFEAVCDSAHGDRVLMGLHQAQGRLIFQDTYEVLLQTTRGEVQAILTASQGRPGVVLWLPGGGSNLNGPAGGVYADLAGELQAAGMTSLRVEYRDQDSLQECVLDAMAWLCFARSLGAREVVVVGSTLGATVAVHTAILHPMVKAVAVITSQEQTAGVVEGVAPRPLLVLHGGQDTRIPPQVAQEVFLRAGDPKELVIYPSGGYSLSECRDELHQRLGRWLSEQLVGVDAYLEALGTMDSKYPDLVTPAPTGGSGPPGQMVLTRSDIVDLDVDAIVSPTGTWLDLEHTPLAAAIVDRGGWEIQEDLWSQAPLFVGDVAVTGAGRLKARHILHAITGGDSAGRALTREEAVAVTARRSLEMARELGLETIALPAIGTGGRGLPIEKAAQIIVAVVAAHMAAGTTVKRAVFAVVSDGAYRAFEGQLRLISE